MLYDSFKKVPRPSTKYLPLLFTLKDHILITLMKTSLPDFFEVQDTAEDRFITEIVQYKLKGNLSEPPNFSLINVTMTYLSLPLHNRTRALGDPYSDSYFWRHPVHPL